MWVCALAETSGKGLALGWEMLMAQKKGHAMELLWALVKGTMTERVKDCAMEQWLVLKKAAVWAGE